MTGTLDGISDPIAALRSSEAARGLLVEFIPGGALGTPGIAVGSGFALGPGIGG